MFTNKHVIIAMIVAPVLSVLAWFAVGSLTGEQAAPAQPGQSYPLVEKSNCRYESGACDLENEDFKLTLVYQEGLSGPQLVLRSSHPLEGVVLGVGNPDAEGAPTAMKASDGQGLEWRLAIGGAPLPNERIRLVAMAGGSSYFADASTLFLQPREEQLQR
ncbi:MAG: hypothetical protein DRR04_11690 [Gammaproteobacteria bacterium]|nr:MAG: hypothetical protein DRR04_11690 [Gammaproteobacteria bacterium]